jgi:hypothetical protein
MKDSGTFHFKYTPKFPPDRDLNPRANCILVAAHKC